MSISSQQNEPIEQISDITENTTSIYTENEYSADIPGPEEQPAADQGFKPAFDFSTLKPDIQPIQPDQRSETQPSQTDKKSNKNVNDVCNVAKLALYSLDGKNLNRSLQELLRAYQHSRTCEECGDLLGQFIIDLVAMLGIKLPRLQKEDDSRNYKGKPSDLKSGQLGPGTMCWEKPPGNFEPTTTSLELTIEGLEAKCRLKDRLINRLADELRDLAECTGRQDRLVDTLSLQGYGMPPDYDRTTLCNHLLGKPTTSLSQPDEKEYSATNPLSLRVVRQVGPDSLLIEWDQPPPEANVNSYELFIDGLLIQRIRSASRTKALLHPVDMRVTKKICITLNTLDYRGEYCDSYNLRYP